ncbi:MAG TPA: HD domain-containing protein [Candidatus Aquicultor sp.]|jgi:3'-5' exoribonuclease
MTIDLNKLRDGEQVNCCLLVFKKERKLDKNGKPYGDLLIGNKTGSIQARIWDLNDATYNLFSVESVVEISGIAGSFAGRPQIKINSISPVDEGKIDYAEFLPTTGKDMGELQAELLALIGSFRNVHIEQLINRVFDSHPVFESFLKAPAAKAFHHAYLGGLLEHTVSVANLCDSVAKNYPIDVNRDLLVAGALLHDIGKIKELSYLKSIDYTTEGRLIGHHVIGYEMLKQAASGLADIPDEVVLQLSHLILSHHGSYELQSPRRPKTIEALLLHFCDDADAKINMFLQADEIADEDAEWSSYVKPLERFMYLKRLNSTENEALLPE